MRKFEWDFMPSNFTDHDGVITKQLLLERFIELHHLEHCLVTLFSVTVCDDERMECIFHVINF